MDLEAVRSVLFQACRDGSGSDPGSEADSAVTTLVDSAHKCRFSIVFPHSAELYQILDLAKVSQGPGLFWSEFNFNHNTNSGMGEEMSKVSKESAPSPFTAGMYTEILGGVGGVGGVVVLIVCTIFFFFF